MRNLLNSDQSYTGLVQKYIGSAYDNVRIVAENMGLFEILALLYKRGDLDALLALAPDLPSLIQRINDFRNNYYGPRDQAPLQRPDGSAIRDGDLYYNTVKGMMYVRERDVWVPLGGDEIHVQAITVTAKMQHGPDTTLKLDKSYVPGNNGLMVFVNSAYQYPTTAENPSGAYIEANEHEIIFPGNALQVDDVVVVISGVPVSTTTHDVGVEIEEYETLLPYEKYITLPGNMFYNPGLNNLEVFVDGLRQVVNRDYTEESSTSVVFLRPLLQGSMVLFKKGSVIASGQPQAGSGNAASDIEILTTAAEFYSRGSSLDRNKLVLLRGYHMPNDGGYGVFIYDSVLPRAEANGGTLIDASVDLSSQGSGIGIGVWRRQYTGALASQWFGYDRPLVSTLVDMGKQQHGDTQYVLGFAANGDGASGTFFWDIFMPKSRHDGGVIIDPNRPFPQDWTNAGMVTDWFTPATTGNGCWVRLGGARPSLAWFGADKSGVRDTSRILAAVGVSITQSNIGSLHVPAGTYKVDGLSSLDIRGCAAGFVLEGDGEQSILQFGSNTSDMPISFTEPAGNFTVANLNIRSSKRVGSQTGLTLINCSNVMIRDVTFSDLMGGAVKVTRNAALNQSLPCNDISLLDNHIQNCGTVGSFRAFDIAPGAASQDLYICNNRFAGSGTLYAGSGYTDARIEDNNFVSPVTKAIEVIGYDSAIVQENDIFNPVGVGIELNIGPSAEYPGALNTRLVCHNNHIHDAVNQATPGILVLGSATNNGPVVVANNLINTCTGIVCRVSAAVINVAIEHNHIFKVPEGFYGIQVDRSKGGSPEGLRINDNFLDSAVTGRLAALMQIHGAAYVLVDSNVFKRSGAYDLQLSQCAEAVITNNVFLDSNTGNVATHTLIGVDDTTQSNYYLMGNSCFKGATGAPKALVASSNASARIHVSNNDVPNTVAIAGNASTTIILNGADAILQYGKVRHYYAAAMPTVAGVEGDVVWNTAPTAGGTVGWVATAAGWKPFGNIAP